MNIYDGIVRSVSCGSEELSDLLSANTHLIMCDLPPCSTQRELMLLGMQSALTFAMSYAAGKVDVSHSSSQSQSEGRSYSEDHSRDRAWDESASSACSYSFADAASQSFAASASESRDFSDDDSQSDSESNSYSFDRDQTVGGSYTSSYNRAGDRSFANGASYSANLDEVDVESWTTKDSCPSLYDNCPLVTAPGALPDLGVIDLGAPAWAGIGGVGGWIVAVAAWFVDLATGGPSGAAWNHVTANGPGSVLSDPAWGFYDHQCPDTQGENFADGVCPAFPEATLCNGHKRVAVLHERDVNISVFNWAWKYKIEQEWTQQHTITHNCDQSFSRSHSDTSNVADSSSATLGASEAEAESNGAATGHAEGTNSADEANRANTTAGNSSSSAEWGYSRSQGHSEDESQSQSSNRGWSRSQSENWSQSQSQSQSQSNSTKWSDLMEALKNLWATVESELAKIDENRVKMRGRAKRSLLSCKKVPYVNYYDPTNRPMVNCNPLPLPIPQRCNTVRSGALC